MLFNTYQFLIFLPVVLLLLFSLPARGRPLALLAASYFFYMCWRPEYALLLVASTLTDYWVGRRMSAVPTQRGRGVYLLLSLLVNLGLLFTFKYYDFFRHSLGGLHYLFGVSIDLPLLDVLLPVGISFYTFQTISYSIEVYRGKLPAETSLLRFALYVSFFPQLVAGPIERPQHLLPQLAEIRGFDYAQCVRGLRLIAWGLFKKIVIADRLALMVNTVYNAPQDHWGPHIVVATILFAYQIYCDFSGYSDIAIGAAQMLGINLSANFNRPYSATSIPEFWQRWHISLSTWFRDYLYIPLGGNRVGSVRLHANLFVVFLVSGLWHGASWTFVVWGALHGFCLIVGRATKKFRAALTERMGLASFPRCQAWVSRSLTFMLVCLAWIFFRANSVNDAFLFLSRLPQGWKSFGRSVWQNGWGGVERHLLGGLSVSIWQFFLPFGLIAIIELLPNDHRGLKIMNARSRWLRWLAYLLIGFALLNFGVAEEIPFIYFQF